LKRIYKSVKDRKVCGVCGGIAEYFDIDVALVRLVTLLMIIFWGSGLLAYIIAALALSDNPGCEEV